MINEDVEITVMFMKLYMSIEEFEEYLEFEQPDIPDQFTANLSEIKKLAKNFINSKIG